MTEPKRTEYPRAGFKRDSYVCLNGEWEFEFDDRDAGHKEGWQFGHAYTRRINVPFAFQARLSGIGDTTPHDRMWYRRRFDNPRPQDGKRALLNFEGVDYYCEAYVNGRLVTSHTGSATRFTADITDALREGENELTVFAYDPTAERNIPRGKQDWEEKSHEIWYTRTSGIYKTVWLEMVDAARLSECFFVGDIDAETLEIDCYTTAANVDVTADISFEGAAVASVTAHFSETAGKLTAQMPGAVKDRLWDIGRPNLFDVVLTLRRDGAVKDRVACYFGFRKIETANGRVLLNGKPLYQKLLLNQSYFPDGILTAPSAEALKQDIETMQAYGFNGCRIHQKTEDDLFYYYADRAGFLVWCESPSCYGYTRRNPERMLSEWLSIVRQFYNFPSVIVWTPLNESWGVEGIDKDGAIQAHAKSLYYAIKSLDPTRLVVGNDGWEHCKTDLITVHNYIHGVSGRDEKFQRYADTMLSRQKLLKDGTSIGKRILIGDDTDPDTPILLSEFGGISFESASEAGSWGYTTCKDGDDYLANLKRLLKAVTASPCICGYCLTQFTDVEQETNGIVTYDRKDKVPAHLFKEIIEGL